MKSLFGLNPSGRSFWLSLPGFSRLSFCPEADLDGRKIVGLAWSEASSPAGEVTFLARSVDGIWKLSFCAPEDLDVHKLELSLNVKLVKAAKAVVLRPVVFPTVKADHLLVHGRTMGGCFASLLTLGRRDDFESHFWITLSKGDYTFQLSHALAQGDISLFSGRTAGARVCELSATTTFESGKRRNFTSATVTLSSSRDAHDQLVKWADAQITQRAPLVSHQDSGWNSWDYYRWTINEEQVYQNAELIASDPILSNHVKRIVIDDGWQYCYGEWEPNCFFPSGMEKLARNLTHMGFTPGLWFAPTITELHSRFAQLYPEVLATGASGYPCLAFSCMERKGFVLDPTHPRIRAWWSELFQRYAGYGYKYFKLDFLTYTVRGRRFYDRRTKPGDLMRRIIEPIREAIGPKSRILGCNYAFEGGASLVNDVRISADIHACWEAVKENAISIAARFWAQERLWINDPDFTLCRGEDTSDDPDLHRLKPILPFVLPDDTNPSGKDYLTSLVDLKRREAEVLLSLVVISGGAMNLSDNLTRLNAVGIDLLRRAVRAEKGKAALPLDLFRSELPSYWVQKLDPGLHRILLVNWKDDVVRHELDLSLLNIPCREFRDFWQDRSVVTKGGRLSASLPPHSCLFVEGK